MEWFRRKKKKEAKLLKSRNKQNTGEDKRPETGQCTRLEGSNSDTVCHDIDSKSNSRNRTSDTFLVAAIDFGTTFSGWAFSFKHEFMSEPTKASVKQWFSGSHTTEKTPTVALIHQDGKTLKAFGYEAENEYKDLMDEGEHENYFYFQRFKMMLHTRLGETLDRTITLEDAMGRSLPALDVFSLSINYLVSDVMKAIEDKVTSRIKSEEILWVITVPAIWTDAAKQFMREAAVRAGINTERLIIALEPEAASVYCRHLPVDKTVDGKEVSISTFSEGTKYVVLDAGGGTVDITVHEVVSDGVKEIKAASGGGWGGTMVDKAFGGFLVEIFGPDVFDTFKKGETEDWLDLWRDFEMKKKGVSYDKTSKITLKFPLSLINMFQERTGRVLSEAIASTRYGLDIGFASDKIKFSSSVFKHLFDEPIKHTIDHLKTLMDDIDVKAILMVGGFSESPMLQHAVKTTFKDIEVVIPVEASSSILRGALICGHSPHFITERVLKFTYGIECYLPFIHGTHEEHRLVVINGEEYCDQGFQKFVEKGQVVRKGDTFTDTFMPVDCSQKHMEFPVYASELKSPFYVDQGCKYVGTMDVLLETHHRDDHDRNVNVTLQFSGTEIQIEGVDKKSNQKTHISLNFLG
ncbi:heat shock 70 kDa protein 12A-like [Mercenaria mercenaria]|uniref:heat shock 70 kDa protein 12A-like n=1 Tax=Mercenaria mercenaria TaxID=6596 RepID=UPI00234E8336|nr:heat shock 70 kDa protein 12A-like [Mercenaria mercenaria]